jgi:hypothetical protein
LVQHVLGRSLAVFVSTFKYPDYMRDGNMVSPTRSALRTTRSDIPKTSGNGAKGKRDKSRCYCTECGGTAHTRLCVVTKARPDDKCVVPYGKAVLHRLCKILPSARSRCNCQCKGQRHLQCTLPCSICFFWSRISVLSYARSTPLCTATWPQKWEGACRSWKYPLTAIGLKFVMYSTA